MRIEFISDPLRLSKLSVNCLSNEFIRRCFSWGTDGYSVTCLRLPRGREIGDRGHQAGGDHTSRAQTGAVVPGRIRAHRQGRATVAGSSAGYGLPSLDNPGSCDVTLIRALPSLIFLRHVVAIHTGPVGRHLMRSKGEASPRQCSDGTVCPANCLL